MSFGYDRLDRWGDPVPEFEAAERDFLEVIRFHPSNAEAWMAEGDLLSNRALYAWTHGQDPEPYYASGERHFTRAVELDPALFSAWRGRAILRTYRARYASERGEDAAADRTGALEDLNRFIILAEKAEGWRLADALLRQAMVLSDRILERRLCDAAARSDLAQAEENFERALALDGGQARLWSRRGAARLGLARLRMRTGEDPIADLGRAESDLSVASERDPRYTEAWIKRGVLRASRARFLEARREDPAKDLGGALADLTRVIDLNREALEAWTEGGGLRLWQAELEEKHRRPQPAREELSRAAADYSQAMLINPSIAERLEGALQPVRNRLKSGAGER